MSTRLLTAAEVASILGAPRSWVYERSRQGLIPTVELDRFGWLGARTYDSDWDDEQRAWRSIGYPQDWSATGQTAAYQRDFLLNELGADLGSARLIRSDTFDNWPGQSGSPIFGFWSNGPYVVGVVSGQGADYNYISGGSLLTSIVRRARNDHP